jgi:hypothetical protein
MPPQASIHSLTLRLSPIFVVDGEKGQRWMKGVTNFCYRKIPLRTSGFPLEP